MKKIIFLFVALLLSLFFAFAGQGYATDGDIPVDAAHFPDKNFRNYLFNEYGDSVKNIAGIKYLNVDNNDIAALTDIEYFTALEDLR